METAVICIVAVLLDYGLGEPRRFHPLVSFGNLAVAIEKRLNRAGAPKWSGRLHGCIAVLLLLLPAGSLAIALNQQPIARLGLGSIFLYFCLGQRSLREHAEAVAAALTAGELNVARAAVDRIVSRDTQALDENGVCNAAIESVLENGNDAIFGALFWFAVAGFPGAVIFRLANTLDAMWGYRNERYQHYGWAAARFDDLLNFIPARLTAFTYAMLGQTSFALRCWRDQSRAWKSPNAGPVMAAGAGTLGLLLGGPSSYHGRIEQRPALGAGRLPRTADIGRSIALIRQSVWLWLTVISVFFGVFHA
jgi:adenosylcobinamide-phosphate synthase